MNSIELIRSYKNLLDEGVLDENEFAKLKYDALKKEDPAQSDVFELLKGYKSLADDGLITQNDFEERKSLLLNKGYESVNESYKPNNTISGQEEPEKTTDEIVKSINEKSAGSPTFELRKIQDLKNNKKALIIIVAAVVLLIFLIGGTTKLSADERHVVDCIKSVSDNSTISVSDAYVIHHEYDSGEKVTYAVAQYSGTNSYGNLISGTAVFKDGSYLMDYYDDIPIDGSDLSIDKAVAMRDVKLAPSNEITKVNVKKINKALK